MIKASLSEIYQKAMWLMVDYLPKFLLAMLVLIIGWWLLKRVAKITEKALLKKEIDPSLSSFLRTSITIFLKVVLLVTVAGMIGIQTTSLVALLGAAGLAVGLALQGSLSNFAGGALILIFKPFKVGDIVEINSFCGEVKEIQIFNTVLLTAEHKTIIIPNGKLANGIIINFSKTGEIRTEIQLKISAENNIDKVKKIVEKIILEEVSVLKLPMPQVFLSGFGNNSINLNVRFFTLLENQTIVEAQIWEKIKVEFDKQEIKDFCNFSYVKSI